MSEFRVGIGYDIHPLVPGRKLILGGVEIAFEKGLFGHSDADVLIHAIMDAIIGALGLGDIGEHFPDSDPTYKDISSLILLSKVEELLSSSRFRVVNVDSVIIAEAPKLSPYIGEMRKKLASVLKVEEERINIKATTNERIGDIGEGKAIASQAVVLLVSES
ncbi:MAG: 2-C-methyl-D-erythritol 2,4-cyclodiphosphate synthase [Acidobacteria bacterium]|nr:2-C-methyl-D-erythritol 2,4-cyclodiphosphate synthase [Acidobacteriota bacterium]